jgi:hypothetical protein
MVVELCVLCLYVNLKLCVFFAQLGFENFPPLMSRSGSPRAPREKLQNETIANLHSRLAGMERDLEECKNLAHHSSKNVIILCAAEILKRTVNLRGRGEQGGEGKQFSRPDLFEPVVVSI